MAVSEDDEVDETNPLNKPDNQYDTHENENVNLCSSYGARYFQAILMFLAMVTCYMMRVNISIAIVAMVDEDTVVDPSGYKTFNWSPKEVGALFSSFFAGYCVMNLVAGMVANKVSNKWLLEFCVLYSAASTLLTPLITNAWGYVALLCLRLSLGIVQSLLMPCIFGLMSRWVPPNERASLGTLVIGGLQMGTLVMFTLGGLLASGPGGWPSIFYLSGSAGVAWCVAWAVLGAESPDTALFISRHEKEYIQESLKKQTSAKRPPIPWKKIFTNKPCYAVTVAFAMHNIGFWTLLTEMPTYFNYIIKFDLTSNGWITALPYFTQWMVSLGMSFVADFLIRKGITSTTTSRKLCNTIGQWGSACALLVLSHIQDDTSAVSVYMVCVTIMGFAFMGFNVNTLDLAPNYASLIMGLVNGVGNVASLLAPLYAGFIISDNTSATQWRTVFYTSAGALFIGNTVFLIFGTANAQEFNSSNEEINQVDTEDAGEKKIYRQPSLK